MLNAFLALVFAMIFPEPRTTTGVRSLRGEAFWAVFDLRPPVPAEIDCEEDFAH
jgi:hypothetical protein